MFSPPANHNYRRWKERNNAESPSLSMGVRKFEQRLTCRKSILGSPFRKNNCFLLRETPTAPFPPLSVTNALQSLSRSVLLDIGAHLGSRNLAFHSRAPHPPTVKISPLFSARHHFPSLPFGGEWDWGWDGQMIVTYIMTSRDRQKSVQRQIEIGG